MPPSFNESQLALPPCSQPSWKGHLRLTDPPIDAAPLLSVRISADYRARENVLRDVAFEIEAGEMVGLAGQSGSGKSTIALAIMRLLHLKGGVVRGQIRFRGGDLLRSTEREMRAIRGREISLVLQNPVSSLNPALRIGTQLVGGLGSP